MEIKESERKLLSVIDYILNYAGEKELEIIKTAVDKKNNELYKKDVSILNAAQPEQFAKQMSESINKSIQTSIDGVRRTVRDFAENIILKEAPELNLNQVDALLNLWIPENVKYTSSDEKINKDHIDGIPSKAMYDMIIQFVSFSIGEMSEYENDQLKSEIGNWIEKYWKVFPLAVKEEVKKFITGNTTSGEFQNNIKAIIF